MPKLYKLTFKVPEPDGEWPQGLLDAAFERIHDAVLDEGFEVDDEVHEIDDPLAADSAAEPTAP